MFALVTNFQVKTLAEYPENFIKFDLKDPTFKITGSKPDSTDNWPYVTALNFYNGTHNNFCVGSLIKKNWVLTAAHCIPSNLVEIYGVILRNNLYEDTGATFMGKLVTTHHQYVYKKNNITNDIALVRLQESLLASPSGIAKLADNPLTKDTICRVFGWGLDLKINSIFHFYSLKVKVITVSDCMDRMSEKIINDAKICTVWRKHINSCIGNTGGPLICNGEQYGILSWSPDCALGSYPIIWTRLEYYLDWINTVIRSETDHEYGDNLNADLYKIDDLVKEPTFFNNFLSKKPQFLERDAYYMDQQEAILKEDHFEREARDSQFNFLDILGVNEDDIYVQRVTTSTEYSFNPLIARPNKFQKKILASKCAIFTGHKLLLLYLVLCSINS